jgi:membrane-associated phospholipid phosphatase
VFVHMVKCLYATDTATNLFPSIHVYNSIAVNLAVWHSENFRDKKVIRIGSAVLMVSIILSTMFLKQHSVFDVVTGIIMAVFMYMLVYVQNPARMTVGERKYERKLHQI